MDKRDVHHHDVPADRMAELVKLILVVLGAVLLFIGWYAYLG